MRVAVLGAGSGGCALAWDLAHHGHEVSLFDFGLFPGNISTIADHRGIQAQGAVEGFAPIHYAGHDIEHVLGDAELVAVVGPAYSTDSFAEVCRGRLQPGQQVLLCPGSAAGALEFRRVALQGGHPETPVAETSTLPYRVRIHARGRIHVYLKLRAGVLLAALPASATDQLVERLHPVLPCLDAVASVWHTTLQNGGPVVNPAITLLNGAAIERGDDLLFFEQGVTPAVARTIEAIDRERIAIAAAMGIEILPEPRMNVRQGYLEDATYFPGYAKAPGLRGIAAQEALDHRYLHEDVGYGLILLEDLGRRVMVATPMISAMITLASNVTGRDYRGEARRTLSRLGLGDVSAGDLVTCVN